ncbi:MAG TPA: site-2 protease family protein, partial [Opitutaceae bacterium]|nr:site-2 protease family protein [Opitutaceae bacterium]
GRNLLIANLVMGCFNLIPVFPMDGGRIFRALLAMRLPYLSATFWAMSVGKVLALLAVLSALYYEDYLVAALFAFILFAGDAEYRYVKRREIEDAQWADALRHLYREPPLLPL